MCVVSLASGWQLPSSPPSLSTYLHHAECSTREKDGEDGGRVRTSSNTVPHKMAPIVRVMLYQLLNEHCTG